MTLCIGMDIGSFTSKGVLVDERTMLDAVVVPSSANFKNAGAAVFETLLARNGLARADVARVVSTGTGRKSIDFAASEVTDIVCSARGIHALAPSVRTLIDVGAQSTQVVWLDGEGKVTNFAANEKCATGSGRFLQVIANVLRVRLEEIGPLSLQAKSPVTFTTSCAVFGESEAITRVSEGVAKEDILAGVHRSLADKIFGLIRGRGLELDCAVCGGGALDVGLLRALEGQLGARLLVAENPLVVTALGAALVARREEAQAAEKGS